MWSSHAPNIRLGPVDREQTSALIAYVNEAEPGAIPWHYSFVLTGRTDVTKPGVMVRKPLLQDRPIWVPRAVETPVLLTAGVALPVTILGG